ncbi:MAG TPA: type III pantothenate kinase [Flavobacteriales bacterium]|nr:type III pantothenate kinase [Flavobacteriales bacterium]
MEEHDGPELVLDVGNSSMKAGLFAGHRLQAVRQMPHGDMPGVRDLLGGRRPARCIMGSVAATDEPFLKALGELAPVTVIRGDSPSPVPSVYATKATLGVDRLANVAAAAALFPGRPVLAIDLGTCITHDLIDAQGIHRGGIIAPGLRMRAKAMHAFSARLPQVEPPEDPVLPGTDTRSSLAAGVHYGVLMELQGYIGLFQQQFPRLAVVLTGGDAVRAARALKCGIFAHPALTLLGLHALAHHETLPSPSADR